MTTELATTTNAEIVERVVLSGDLSKLSPAERVSYYRQVCDSLALNPLTRPFDYIVLNGKLTLYARKDATEQLRKRDGVSVVISSRELVDGIYVVTARATTADGRTDESIGAVSVEGLKGEARANAFMKAETKSKRRVTLSIVGLGWLDETEVSSIPDARPVMVDTATGEIVEHRPTNGKPQIDAAEAEKRFYAHYGATIEGNDWTAVRRYFDFEGVPISVEPPATYDGWRDVAEKIRDKVRTQQAVEKEAA
jgi:hypothetical protein